LKGPQFDVAAVFRLFVAIRDHGDVADHRRIVGADDGFIQRKNLAADRRQKSGPGFAQGLFQILQIHIGGRADEHGLGQFNVQRRHLFSACRRLTECGKDQHHGCKGYQFDDCAEKFDHCNFLLNYPVEYLTFIRRLLFQAKAKKIGPDG